MDFESYIMATGHTDEEIEKVTQTINNIQTGGADLSGYPTSTEVNNLLNNKASKNGSTSENFSAKDMTVVGNIIPSSNGTQNIGSPDNRFSTIYVNEAKLSTNTLYIGDTPVMGTSEDTIMIKADTDQSITMKSSGVGTTKVISQSNVELSTSGMNANVNVQATGSGANANLSATNEVNLTGANVNIHGSTNISGGATVDNLTVNGNIVMNGSAFTVEATTVKIEDNIIELNKNEVGTGVTTGRAGLKINRGDSDAYLMIFDETDDNFKVGTDSTLKIISTKDYVDSQDANKVDKVIGKSLILDTEITRLASITGTNTGDETQATIKNKIGVANTSQDGYLTSIDWNTFNNKAILYPTTDGISAIKITKADKSTPIVTVDTTNSKVILNGTLNLIPITTAQRNALTGLSSCSIVFDSDLGSLMCYDGSIWYQL